MIKGSYKIEAGGRFVEDEMHTITAGVMSLMDSIFNRATTYPYQSLRYPAFHEAVPIDLFQLISFDNSVFGYDRDMTVLTSQKGGAASATPLGKKFILAENPYRISYDGDAVVLTKLFKNISTAPYTLKRIFLNVPFCIPNSSYSRPVSDGFSGIDSFGYFSIACDATDFTVNPGETVSIAYRLSFLEGIGTLLKEWIVFVFSYLARKVLDTNYYKFNYKTLSGAAGYDSFTSFVLTIGKNPSHSIMIIGSNGEAPVNDYTLNARIPLAAYAQTSTVTEVAYDEAGQAYVYTIRKLIQNKTASPLSVSEIGLTGSNSDSVADSSLCLLHRSVLSEPVLVPVGGSAEVSIAFNCPVGVKAVIPSTACQGSGTLADPYRVETMANLRWLSITPEVWESSFVQTADIDASSTLGYDLGVSLHGGFAPIGTSANPFAGKYDGQNHYISGLYVASQTKSGLFGCANGAQLVNIKLKDSLICSYSSWVGGIVGDIVSGLVKNCHAENVSITSLSTALVDAGFIAGYAEGTSFMDCSSSGLYTGLKLSPLEYVAGICGYVKTSDFLKCRNYANISGYRAGSRVGGIATAESSSSFSECINYGKITSLISSGSGEAGGIAVATYGGTFSFDKCVNMGEVSSSGCAGAISKCPSSSGTIIATACANYGLVSSGDVGFVYLGSSSTVTCTDCFNAGRYYRTNGSSTNSYAIASTGKASESLSVCKIQSSNGVNWNVDSIFNKGFLGTSYTYSGGKPNYYDATVSEQTSGAGATAKTTAELKQQATYVGWNFTNIWAIDPAKNSGYPYLVWMAEHVPAEISYYE